MIPRLDPNDHLPAPYREFLAALPARGFTGEIRTDYATRLVTATDNSVYQIVPLAVVFPKIEGDVAVLLRLAHEARFRSIKLSPRGGGTGTNGQSLSDGIIVDVSRHFRSILEVNLDEGWVRVEPGVVLDQLNSHLLPHGVFFAPSLSPSNRATIGGMIATDASGKGSRVYGKTSHHVLELRAVLMDGSVIDSKVVSQVEHQAIVAQGGIRGSAHRVLDEIVSTYGEKIKATLPKIERFVTGYDLSHVRGEGGTFNLNSVVCGSEGTLCVVTQAKLRLTKIPKHKGLLAIRYPDFDSALRAARVLVTANPGAIETVDDTIVGLAKKDVIWHSVSHLLTEEPGEAPLAAVNLVEFESDDPAVVEAKLAELATTLDAARLGAAPAAAPVLPANVAAANLEAKSASLSAPGAASGYTLVRDRRDIAALWTLRKKGVGLLGNASGDRRPVPFVEDTAVPPEKLADYIREFRALLDGHGLRYGMFGHVDVGCLHVRPALDLRDPGDEKLLREISDAVVVLVKKYGGVLWGEHGKGFRGEYSPVFFGPELYEQLRRVKGAFDPENQLNPGKLATPSGSTEQLISIDTVKRGQYDRQILKAARDKFDVAVSCNGNGACFDWNPDSVMCPSSKQTNDRIHSPKGRAGIMREWLRLATEAGHDASTDGANASGAPLFHARGAEPQDFSHQVYDAMNGCLACKACATQCPIKVDVPSFRSEFLAQYHTRYRRPLKDYFVAMLELLLVPMSLFPRVVNFVMAAKWFKWLLASVVGIIDSPLLAVSTLARGLRQRGAPVFDRRALGALTGDEKARTVMIVQDAFTTFYEPNVALATYDVLTKLGTRVVFLPYRENGKALHIKGFLRRFKSVAEKNTRFFSQVASLGIPLVGLEPAVTLTYRDEYPHAVGKDQSTFRIQLLQEYLCDHLQTLKETAARSDAAMSAKRGGREASSAFAGSAAGASNADVGAQAQSFRLFGHCTERTAEPKAEAQWAQVFAAVGSRLLPTPIGCCGMCGVFGHEAEHFEESRGVFDMSWRKALPPDTRERGAVLVTGHSCRSQVKRFEGFVARHPVEALRDLLRDP